MSITPGVQIKCRICGESDFIKIGNREVCKYCNATYAVYDPGLEAELRMAESFRESAQFEVAAGLYNKIIDTYSGHDLSDAYWGLFLCEQHVMFETDANGVRFPSFYAITPIKPDTSAAFSKAVAAAREFASDKAAVFCELCEKIGNAKELYRRIGESAKPFDIFICFKKTAADGVNYTKDWKMAYDLYDHLSRTYNVFFSDKTLANVVVHQYEPNIYYGLYTAKVMLLLCSKREYLESQWVQNEWSRFYAFSRNHAAGKTIIPIFIDDFQPADLPVRLQSYQGYPDDRNLYDLLDHNLQTILKPAKKVASPTVGAINSGISKDLADYIAKTKKKEEQQKENTYQEGLALMAKKDTASYRKAIAKFESVSDWKDSERKAKECQALIQRAKRKKIKITVWCVIIGLFIAILAVGVSIPLKIQSTWKNGVRYVRDGDTYYVADTKENLTGHVEILSELYGKPVTRIGDSAFANRSLTSISIPSSVTSIESNAFNYCVDLTNTVIPDSVTYIGEGAFTDCPTIIVYYMGTKRMWQAIQGGGNEAISHPYIYAAVEPIGDGYYWHYTGDKPTPW